MSIWTSAPGDLITAADFDHPDTDQYQGSGPQTLAVDVALAVSHHDAFRIAVWERDSKKGGVDVTVLIDRTNLERLRAEIDWALSRKRP